MYLKRISKYAVECKQIVKCVCISNTNLLVLVVAKENF